MVSTRGIVQAAQHYLLLGVCLLVHSMTWGTVSAQAQVVGQLPPIEITSARGALASSLRTVRTLAVQETFGPTAITTALEGRAGLFLQQTSGGGGTAFIRGFTGKQVVYTFDGIRLNNATYRYGPTQYLTTLDPLFVHDAQVLFGPGSVAYGSDAMGGVLALRSAPVPQGGLRATIDAEARQATRGGRLAASVAARGFEGGLSWDVDGDRTAGMGPSPVGAVQSGPRQAYTSRNQRAWFARYATRIERWTVNTMVLETVQRDIPKTNRMVAHDGFEVPDVLNEIDLQRLRLFYARAAAPLVGSLRTNITGYVHQQTERRHVQAALSDPLRSETDDVWAAGGHATVQALPSARTAITVGLSAQYEWIGSWATVAGFSETAPPEPLQGIVAPSRSVYDTRLAGRFPDGSRYSSHGVYVNTMRRMSLRLTLEPSIRWSRYRARVPFGGDLASLDARYHDLTFGVGAAYRLRGGRRLVGSLSRGFRAPNIDDLAVDGAWDNGVDVPNPNIRPEYVWQLETGVHTPVWTVPVHVTTFVAFYQDLIQRVWLDNGLDGMPNTLDDRFQFGNVSEALTWGVEVQASHVVRYTNGDVLDLRVEGSFLWGASQDEMHEPLRRIPPAQLDFQARFQREAVGRFRGRVWLVAPQRRLSGGDRRDTRIPARGSDGFIRVDAGFSQRLGRRVRVRMDLENLLDVRYRLHGSGLDGAGRSFTIGVNVSLGA